MKCFGKLTLVIALFGLFAGLCAADPLQANDGAFCTATAAAIFRSCGNEAQEDYWIAVAFCINVTDDAERAQCGVEAKATLTEDRELCSDQRDGRLDTCKAIGQDRYDPDLDPALFETDFTNPENPNRYFPLKIGNQWTYSGGTETNTVSILNQTKLINGVRCVVARDIVKDEGALHENPDDWYVLAKDGTVWYFGEEVKNYETFEGDRPARAELVSNDGSFKTGRDGDKPGIIFPASPQKGQSYIEEFSLGNAEDVTKILSTTYAFGSDPDLDRSVPQQLAQILCSGDCVVTRNYSLLEPGISARKYYAPGIGVFLEVESTGEVVQLVSCNFDSRCSRLPNP